MNCLSAAKAIKEDREFGAAEIRTVVVGSTGHAADTPKILLTPRVEIHRVHKAAAAQHHHHNHAPLSSDDQQHNQIADQHPPPQVIFTTTSSTRRTSITSPAVLLPTLADPQNGEPLQQRVQVIKDGRCFYAEEAQSRGGACGSGGGGGSQQKDTGLPMHHQQQRAMVYTTSSSPPPLLVHQQPQDAKKLVLCRQVHVISNGLDDDCHSNGHRNGQPIGGAGGAHLFRPPVVSSSSTPMRPPPPPPPPRTKATLSEEPSSSIPDLGKPSQKKMYLYI